MKWLGTAILSFLIALSGGAYTMPNNTTTWPAGAFLISWGGGMQYGSREVFFDGKDKFYFALGDTRSRDDRIGIGVLELTLQNSDLAEMKAAGAIFCDKRVLEGKSDPFQPQVTFQAACPQADRVIEKYGSVKHIPESLYNQLYGTVIKFQNQAWENGRKIVKLDFLTDKIEYRDGIYIVSVRFKNTGNRKLSFKTPNQWPGNEVGGQLGVGSSTRIVDGIPEESTDTWAFDLSGKKIINHDEFPDGIVSLNPGESKTLKVEAIPDYKALKGEYEFTGIAFMDIRCEGEWWTSTRVDFAPVKTRITIDRDYPSTPKEREEWEARHRDAMSSWPVKPGEAFPEDGLYRAVRVGYGTRSLQVQPFKAGDIATTDSVRLLTSAASGNYLDGPVQWVWEAGAPVRPEWDPFTVVEGTEQFCKAGAVCSRSGRWLARFTTMDWKNGHDLSQIVTVQQGKTMPAIRGDLNHADWEWIGA